MWPKWWCAQTCGFAGLGRRVEGEGSGAGACCMHAYRRRGPRAEQASMGWCTRAGRQADQECIEQQQSAPNAASAAQLCKLATSWRQVAASWQAWLGSTSATHAFHGMQRSAVAADTAADDQQVVVILLAARGGRRGGRGAVLAGRLRAHRAASGSGWPPIVRDRCSIAGPCQQTWTAPTCPTSGAARQQAAAGHGRRLGAGSLPPGGLTGCSG